MIVPFIEDIKNLILSYIDYSKITLTFDEGRVRESEVSSSGTDWGVSTCYCNFLDFNEGYPCEGNFKRHKIEINIDDFIKRIMSFFISFNEFYFSNKVPEIFKKDMKTYNPKFRITNEIKIIWRNRTSELEQFYKNILKNNSIDYAIESYDRFFDRVYDNELYFIIIPEEFDVTSIHNAKTSYDYKLFVKENKDKVIKKLNSYRRIQSITKEDVYRIVENIL